MRKRLLATLLAVLMVFSLLPATALAAGAEDTGATAYVAEVNGKGQYATLADAFAAATDGDTVTLIANVELSEGLSAVRGNNKTVTLDLNGFALSTSGNIAITGTNAKLAITDGSVNQTGSLTLTGARNGFRMSAGTASVEIKGGTINANTNGKLSPDSTSSIIVSGGTFNKDVAGVAGVTITSDYYVSDGTSYSYFDSFETAVASDSYKGDDDAYVAMTDSGNGGQSYVVRFVDVMNSTTVAYRLSGVVDVTVPESPVYDGYQFGGWREDEGNTAYFGGDIIENIGAAHTFTAQWTSDAAAAGPYKLSFDPNGGHWSNGSTETVTGEFEYGETYSTTETPECDGFTFVRWVDESGKTWIDGSAVTENRSFTAEWAQNTYTVQFDPNGGNWDGSSESIIQQVAEGSIASIKPADPVRPGYTFTGWWYDGEPWNFETDTVGVDLTLTAGWTEDTYTLTIVWGNGNNNEVIDNLTYGSTYNVNAPEWTGHTFSHWVDADGNTWTPGTTQITADTTITAVWDTNTVKVDFSIDGEVVYSANVEYGAPVESYTPADIPEGYSFDGWYTNNSLSGNKWAFTTPVENGMTLYGSFIADEYTVTFDANAGEDEVTGMPDQQVVKHGERTAATGTPERKYYTFKGWATTAEATEPNFITGPSGTPVTEATTLYAVWEQDEVTLTFNANGGTFSDGTTTYKEITIDAGTKLTEDLLPEISYEGYSFTGWYWPGGTDRLNITETTFANPATFTAYWDINEYTVTFWANGGAWEGIGDTYPVTVEHGSTVVEANGADITAPEREGMAFTVWLDEDGNIFDPKTDAVTGNLRLTAQWDDVYYKVTFDYGNGQASTVQTVKKGENATPPATPEYDGFEFQYWYIDGVGTEYVFSTPVESNFTLKAMWIPKTYIVTINAGANDAVLNINNAPVTSGPIFTVEVTYGQTIADANVVLNNPTRDGYTFSGWYANGAVWTSDTSITSDIEVTASWNAGRYKIAFDLNGAPGTAPAAQTVGHGDTVGRPTDPSWEGHEFLGWFLKGSDTPWDFSNTVSASATLYAGWSNSSYKVSFEGNGGTFTANGNWTGSYSEDVQSGYRVSAEIANPTRDGYTFAGWFDEDGNAWNASTVITGSATYYAKWDANSYELTLYANGGAYADGSNVKVYPASETTPIGNVEIPTREGYVFRGWYTRTDGGERVEFETTSTLDKDTILYAHWTEAVYQVTYQGQDFSWTNKNVKYGSTVKAPTSSNYDVEGYTITGWYTTRTYDDGTEWNFAEDTVTQNTVLYAKYEARTYTITFNANGGEGSEYTQTFTFGEPQQLKANGFVNEGYTFAGWTLDRSTEEILFQDQQIVTFDNADENSDFTVYAVWTQVTHQVTFVGMNGAPDGPYTVAHNGKITATQNLNAAGYTITGWYLNKEFSGEAWNFNEDTVTTDITLYAEYEEVNYTVTFDANGGEGTMDPQVFRYNQPQYLTKNTFTREGYVTGAPGQDISINLENNDGVLEIANPNNPITEYTNDNGTSTYEAVYKVVGIPRDEVTITFTATDSFGTTASISQTMKLRTVVYAFLKDSDGTPLNIEAGNVALHSDKDPYDHPPLAMTYNESLGCFVALADQATGYDYLHFVTTDGREVFVRNTTAAGETITYALSGLGDTDGEVTIDYTFGAYTVIAQLNVNGTPVDRETYSVSGNYGAEIPFSEISAWASGRVNTWLYPNADEGSYNITFTTMDGKPVTFGTYGDDVVEWVDNTVYVYANVTVGSYVEFDLNYDANNDGNPANDMYGDPVFILDGGAVNKPDPDPTRAGYLFTGWYTDAACTNLYDFALPVTGYLKLYAGWDKNTYTVTFNNGYGDDYAAGTPWAPQYVEYQGYLAAPTENPTRDGYTFLGWSTEPDGTTHWDFAQNQVLGSFTLYAVWEQNDYTLFYHNVENANNASLFYNVTPIHYGDVINEPEENPERDSFIFQGWYTDPDCTELAQFPITVGEGDVHLYAKWADAVTVYFVYNDGSGLIDSVKIVKGTAVPEPEIPTYAGHYFTGWYAGVENYGEESENWTNAYEWDFDTQVNDTIFLYAGWESATIQGNFFNKTPTGVYVALERQDYTGKWVPASGIDDLTVGAWRLVNGQPDSDENLLFPGVHMTEILPGSELWQSGWDPDYAYYYATWDTALTGSVRFYLEAEGYTFVSTPGQVG